MPKSTLYQRFQYRTGFVPNRRKLPPPNLFLQLPCDALPQLYILFCYCTTCSPALPDPELLHLIFNCHDLIFIRIVFCCCGLSTCYSPSSTVSCPLLFYPSAVIHPQLYCYTCCSAAMPSLLLFTSYRLLQYLMSYFYARATPWGKRVCLMHVYRSQPCSSSSCRILFAVHEERAVLYKDQLSQLYRPSAYYLAKTVVEMVTVGVYPAVFVSLAYWMGGFIAQADNYCLFLLVIYMEVVVMQVYTEPRR